MVTADTQRLLFNGDLLEFVKSQLELGNVEGAKHYIAGVLEDLK